MPAPIPPLSRRLLAAVLAAALALGALPAQAQDLQRRVNPEAVAAAIFGLATLAIIANEINRDRDDDDDDDDKVIVHRNHAPPVSRVPAPRVFDDRHRPHGHVRKVRPITVPASCARRVEYRGQERTAFGAPCLRRAGVEVARLPGRCARRLDVGRRGVTAFGARCLYRAGVRID